MRKIVPDNQVVHNHADHISSREYVAACRRASQISIRLVFFFPNLKHYTRQRHVTTQTHWKNNCRIATIT